MNPFLNDIFHILYPLYVTSSHSNEDLNTSSSMNVSDDGKDIQEMDSYLYYIFGIVVRDIRLYSRSAIGDIIHEIKEVNQQVLCTIPHAYELLFKSVELNPYNW